VPSLTGADALGGRVAPGARAGFGNGGRLDVSQARLHGVHRILPSRQAGLNEGPIDADSDLAGAVLDSEHDVRFKEQIWQTVQDGAELGIQRIGPGGGELL
jgi:hypothetical protein